MGDICSIKTESASGCAAICWAESNEFPIKRRTSLVYTNQILTTRKKKNLPHMCYKCKRLLKRAVYNAAALQKKEEPSLVRENSNGTIYSKILLVNLIWQRISAGIFLIFPDVNLAFSRKGSSIGYPW